MSRFPSQEPDDPIGVLLGACGVSLTVLGVICDGFVAASAANAAGTLATAGSDTEPYGCGG